MAELSFEHVHTERIETFIDGPNASLKAVLLQNGNEKPSIPIAHAVDMKEIYESIVLILQITNYNKYKRKICTCTGYTKNCCFLCL